MNQQKMRSLARQAGLEKLLSNAQFAEMLGRYSNLLIQGTQKEFSKASPDYIQFEIRTMNKGKLYLHDFELTRHVFEALPDPLFGQLMIDSRKKILEELQGSPVKALDETEAP